MKTTNDKGVTRMMKTTEQTRATTPTQHQRHRKMKISTDKRDNRMMNTTQHNKTTATNTTTKTTVK